MKSNSLWWSYSERRDFASVGRNLESSGISLRQSRTQPAFARLTSFGKNGKKGRALNSAANQNYIHIENDVLF